MNQRILECLNGEHGSYVLPFLWLHGETHARLLEEIMAIKNSGIREFCAESRPYDDFGKDAWWEDIGFILKTPPAMRQVIWKIPKEPICVRNWFASAM